MKNEEQYNEIYTQWCERLLDKGKRNGLLYYKPSAGLAIVAPDIDAVNERIGRAFTFFDVDEALASRKRGKTNQSVEDFGAADESRTEFLKNISAKSKLVCYNSAGVNKSIKRLMRKARVIADTGVNALFFAAGFLSMGEIYAPVLLRPVEINGQKNSYSIRAIGDTVVNPMLEHTLSNDYKIEFPEFNDESVGEYLSIVSMMLPEGAKIVREGVVGLFSFLKMNMYSDLTRYRERALANPLVASVLGDSERAAAIGVNVDDYVPARYNVVDADGSQQKAIAAAKRGESFVLQGPPGTGKSQTITNIIAELLGDGKRVLFVSEKSAALNVVYRNLQRAALGDYCLALHSRNTDKAAVINDLCRTLRKGGMAVSAEAAQVEQSLSKDSCELQGYAEKLHGETPFGKPYDIFEKCAHLSAVADCGYSFPMPSFDLQAFERGLPLIDTYEKLLPHIGSDYHSNYYIGMRPNLAQDTFADTVKNAIEKVKAVKKAAVSANVNINGMTAARHAIAAESATDFTLKNGEDIMKYVKLKAVQAKELLSDRAVICKAFTDDIFTVDADFEYNKLIKDYKGALRGLKGGYRKLVKAVKAAAIGRAKVNYDKLVALMMTLKTFKEKQAKFTEGDKTLRAIAGDLYNGERTDFNAVANIVDAVTAARNSGVNVADIPQNRAAVKALKTAVDEASVALLAVYESEPNADFDALINTLARAASSSLYGAYREFYALKAECESANLMPFVDTLAAQAIDGNVVECYKATYYRSAQKYLKDTVLADITSTALDALSERFRNDDRRSFAAAQARIAEKLSALRPDSSAIATTGQAAMLLREGEKRRRQMSVRAVVNQLKDIVRVLKPCFLMSPLSVSTFLDGDQFFDVVIFDEASQIFPEDALPALYRSKSAIVVGDSKQMPPSNFFANLDDEGDGDVSDFESILDVCGAVFPQTSLEWHYRSRVEGLIAFSNHEYYEDRLLTFPSAIKEGEGFGVEYRYAGGIFDRLSKVNAIEARKVAELAVEYSEKYPKRTLAIVAFSVSQQEAIEDCLEKLLTTDERIEYFSSEREEPVIVKNLESVQGDERDCVILSIGYAPDKNGKFILNFGPLNREGGGRRLNVAVTRAKLNLIVVASIHASDIDLKRSNSEGVRQLKDYLEYSENNALSSFGKGEDTDALRKEVYDYLIEKGYDAEMNVGRSGHKIDIAVKDENGYKIAIELDGNNYYKLDAVRDRERLRREVLTRMGWSYYRLWTAAWVRDKDFEKKKLFDAVEQSFAATRIEKEEVVREESFTAAMDTSVFDSYEYADLKALVEKYRRDKDFCAMITAILKVEAPLNLKWLKTRITEIGARLDALPTMLAKTKSVMLMDGFLYLSITAVNTLRAGERDIENVAVDELGAGLKRVIAENPGVTVDGAYKAVANALQIKRLSPKVRERLDFALNILKLKDEVVVNGEVLQLLN